MTQSNTEFLAEKLDVLITKFVVDYSAHWVQIYNIAPRPVDKALDIFTADPEFRLNLESFNQLTPEALPIYEGMYSRQDEGLFLDAFAVGASSVANMIIVDEHPLVGEFVNTILDKIVELTVFPKIAEDVFPIYVEAMAGVMVQDEEMLQKAFYSYLVGVCWLLGHLSNREVHMDRVRDMLQHKVRLGTYIEY